LSSESQKQAWEPLFAIKVVRGERPGLSHPPGTLEACKK
jgi:hypothetical protein